MNILLIAPETPTTFWSYRHALRFIRRRALLPPLGLLTVAGTLPRSWNLRLIDMNVASLSDADIEWADYAMISAMILEADSVRAVAARCAAIGTPMIAGGPLFTTGHERFPEINHLVLGEAELIMPQLIGDMQSRSLDRIYRADARPDLTSSPLPRWDLVDFKAYALMPVQFSRGCPFDCDFCDITVMYGRTPRTKTPQQVIRELDALLDHGWDDSIFIVDDNFIGHKRKAAELLDAIIEWRRKRRVRSTFTTEASVNLADAPELLSRMIKAGFKQVFIGIETPNVNSLIECSKVQNTRRDLGTSIQRIQNAGMEVLGGFIVGFDGDGPGIFEQQFRFIQSSGIVTAMVGLLNALPQTRLYARLKEEGRLLRESTGNNLDAVLNFVPGLDRDVLLDGYRTLVKRLYAPGAFYARAATFLRAYRPSKPAGRVTREEVVACLRSFWVLGVRSRGRIAYWSFVVRTFLRHPHKFAKAMDVAIRGHHFRRIASAL